MKDSYTDQPSVFVNEINLLEILNIVLQGKWIIAFFTAFISIIAVIYSLLLPNIYESKALLVPVNSDNGISGALGSYGGLAGLAGIKLPSGNEDTSAEEAIQKIRSLSFFEHNILSNIYLPDLMAVKFWDSKKNVLVFDKDIYDSINNTWIRKYSFPEQQIPSAQESFEVFLTEHLSLNENKKSGFITLSIKHQSPYVAKQWVELIVNEVNNYYRQKDKFKAEKSFGYLNQRISTTSFSEIKEVLAQLMQEELKKLTLIEANQYYVFDYIDPPVVMEKKIGPKRALICILSSLLGVIFSIFIVLMKHYIVNQKDT